MCFFCCCCCLFVFFQFPENYNECFYFVGQASNGLSNFREADLDSRVILVQGEQILLSVTVPSFS